MLQNSGSAIQLYELKQLFGNISRMMAEIDRTDFCIFDFRTYVLTKRDSCKSINSSILAPVIMLIHLLLGQYSLRKHRKSRFKHLDIGPADQGLQCLQLNKPFLNIP